MPTKVQQTWGECPLYWNETKLTNTAEGWYVDQELKWNDVYLLYEALDAGVGGPGKLKRWLKKNPEKKDRLVTLLFKMDNNKVELKSNRRDIIPDISVKDIYIRLNEIKKNISIKID